LSSRRSHLTLVVLILANATFAQQPPPAAPYDDDDMPEDIDAFRARLTRRIEAFLEAREDEDGAPAAPAVDSAES